MVGGATAAFLCAWALPLAMVQAGQEGGASNGAAPWAGEEMPLPLVVKTGRDLALKAEAERVYLIFNLLAGGKAAFDRGDYGLAAKKWRALLALPDISPGIHQAVQPLLLEAERGAPSPGVAATGGSTSTPAPSSTAVAPPPAAPKPPVAPVVRTASIAGQTTGGGALGPGGAVVWLRRVDGQTPRPKPGKPRVVSQRNKMFIPRVLAVPVGTTVTFRNDDDFFHNVFSLSAPGPFDTGLYKAGGSYSQKFAKPGAVQLLCNIHASMSGYIYVVDSPYYTQANEDGAFVIRNVPHGEYELSAWHEASLHLIRKRVTVGADGVSGVTLTIPADRTPPAFTPDKYGKPRQPNLGY